MHGAFSESPSSEKKRNIKYVHHGYRENVSRALDMQVWKSEYLKFSDIIIYFLSAFGQISNSLVHFSLECFSFGHIEYCVW